MHDCPRCRKKTDGYIDYVRNISSGKSTRLISPYCSEECEWFSHNIPTIGHQMMRDEMKRYGVKISDLAAKLHVVDEVAYSYLNSYLDVHYYNLLDLIAEIIVERGGKIDTEAIRNKMEVASYELVSEYKTLKEKAMGMHWTQRKHRGQSK